MSSKKMYSREVARTPLRPHMRALNLFTAPANRTYLHATILRLAGHALPTYVDDELIPAMMRFASPTDGIGIDALTSDVFAQRGISRPALNVWQEVQRLNKIFIANFIKTMSFAQARAAPRDGLSDDDEPYHMRMFTADSLRPPGQEQLNSAGPLYELLEDQEAGFYKSDKSLCANKSPQSLQQVSCKLRPDWPQPVRITPSGPQRVAAPPFTNISHQSPERFTNQPDKKILINHDDDSAWRAAAPRTPEQAIIEYWGDGHVASETILGDAVLRTAGAQNKRAADAPGIVYGDLYAWGRNWQNNGGTRFMRLPSIPFWQKGGHEGYDLDIEETLGTGGRELDYNIRGWDMSRAQRASKTRRYGAR